ncbi:aconitase X [Guggenheimella bovis]
MNLTPAQQEILDGKHGETRKKLMETMVRYGELFGATEMAEITSSAHHFVTSFGLKALKPIYELLDQLIEEGIKTDRPFTVDPKPLDKNVPSTLLQDIVFSKLMYTKQDDYEEQLKKLGLKDNNAFSCASYLKEVGNIPKRGDILSWSESSAVVYANSVLGAKCNRNSGILDLMGAIVGYVPVFGLLTEEGRKADWIIEVKTSKVPEAQLLGSAIGMKVMEDVPYIKGLDQFLGDTLTEETKAYLKDFGAATASNGAVGLYHVENLTPEAKELGEKLLKENVKTYVIDDAELERVEKSYPIIWKNKDAKPKLCFIGCPHLSMEQLTDWSKKISDALKKNGRSKVTIPTVLTSAPDVVEAFLKKPSGMRLKEMGVTLSYICPLMYMNNPLAGKRPVITSSNKLRTYTSARYYKDADILELITGGKR